MVKISKIPRALRWRRNCFTCGMTKQDKILKEIIEFADKAHGDQLRKYSPERYIVHPVRVMKLVKETNNDVIVLAAAILHDVVEDTSTSKHDIEHYLIQLMPANEAERTVSIVDELTDHYTKKKHPAMNRHKRKAKEHERLGKVSAEAQTIKYADLIDNCVDITKNDIDFAPRYLAEAKDLLRRMRKGDARLRSRATETVEECEKELKQYLAQ